MNTKTSRFLRQLSVCTSLATAMGIALCPQDAKANSVVDVLIDVGISVITGGISDMLSDGANLSQGDLEDIGDIVDQSISEEFINFYLGNANAAVDQVEAYPCDGGELTAECATRAYEVWSLVNSSVENLQTVDLPGAAWHATMTALEVSMLYEWRRQEIGRNDPNGQVDNIDDLLLNLDLTVDHVRDMADQYMSSEYAFRSYPWTQVKVEYQWPIASNATQRQAYVYFTEPHIDAGFYRQVTEACTALYITGCQAWDTSETDQAVEDARAARELAYAERRTSVLGASFDALADELEFAATGLGVDYESPTELFCELYDGQSIRFWSYGVYLSLATDGQLSPHDDTAFTVQCINSNQRMRLIDTTGLYVRSNAQNGLTLSENTGDRAKFVAFMQRDGQWAIRSYANGQYVDVGGYTDHSGMPNVLASGVLEWYVNLSDLELPTALFTIVDA